MISIESIDEKPNLQDEFAYRQIGAITMQVDPIDVSASLETVMDFFRDNPAHSALPIERNGVLIYVCVADRLVAVVGDKGINERVPEGFWDNTIAVLKLHFAAGRHADGLCEAVDLVADRTAAFFPASDLDTNELSNEVSFGRS